MYGDRVELREAILEKLKSVSAPHEEGLADYCLRLWSSLRPRTVILHGSVARGLHGRWSDLDILVVADFEEPFLDRILMLLKLAEPSLPVEPLGYTPTEFDDMFKRLNALVLDALEFGIPLLGEEFFTSYKRRLEELKRSEGLRRAGTGWTRA